MHVCVREYACARTYVFVPVLAPVFVCVLLSMFIVYSNETKRIINIFIQNLIMPEYLAYKQMDWSQSSFFIRRLI